jgi:hypothetical protein
MGMKKVMAYLLVLLLAAAAHAWVTRNATSARPGADPARGDMSQVESSRGGAFSTLCDGPDGESEGAELPGSDAERANGSQGGLMQADCERETTAMPARLSI